MSLKTLVQNYLEKQPLFRLRSNKDMGIVNILMSRHYKLSDAIRIGVLTKGNVKEIVQEYASMDRAWRQALEHDPNLRGTDYSDKERVEQETEIRLGYVPGHDADVKKLRHL